MNKTAGKKRAQDDNAEQLFLKGVEYERNGNYNEATRCYKRALKLDPDIERKIANEDSVSCSSIVKCERNDKIEDEYDNKEDLFVRFQRIMGPQICFPEHEQRNTHFSDLPSEIVVYIFRWVVSYDLDLRMLEQCAAVCRGWYLCARDSEIWRRACSRFWPSNINELVPYDGSWRRMFIERPSVLTIGCYISKISYVRKGEESFKDNTNGPSFLVDYYRYLRFFSDGQVMMIISNDPPTKIVRKLQLKNKLIYNVTIGHYTLNGNKLFLKLNKEWDLGFSEKYENNNQNKKQIDAYKRMNSYNMVFEISKYKCKHNWKLLCTDYEILHQSPFGNIISTKFDMSIMSSNNFPPFIFSRVKSYTNESERIL